MSVINIVLTEEEINEFNYNLFAFGAIQNQMNQFASDPIFKYNQESYERLLDSYTERYVNIQQNLKQMLHSNNHPDVKIKQYQYEPADNKMLIIY